MVSENEKLILSIFHPLSSQLIRHSQENFPFRARALDPRRVLRIRQRTTGQPGRHGGDSIFKNCPPSASPPSFRRFLQKSRRKLNDVKNIAGNDWLLGFR